MRPLKLTMRAFGPYKDTETVDFTELGDNRLFVIHGETGAGKTSILDAVVFALYGDTSGNERLPGQMRCESADPSTSTEVTFEFALGGESYRVTRRPQQDLARTRGEGVVRQAARAAIWEVTDAAPGAEGDLLASQVRRVDEKVRELLGFSSEQFRQVVVLPQGKFRDLLAAGSDKREEILRQLFTTRECAALERRLKERAREVVARSGELEVERRTRLDAAGAEDEAQLEALTGEAADAAERSRAAADEAEQAARRAAEALAEARRAHDAVGAARAAEERLRRLTDDQARIDALAAGTALGRRAQRVEPVAAELARAEKRRAAAAEREAAAQQALAEAAEDEARAADALRGQLDRQGERGAAADRVRELAATQQRAAAWRAAEAERLEAEAAHEAAAEESQRAAEGLREATAARDLAADQVGKAAAARAEQASAEQRRDRAVEVARLLEKRDAAAAAVESATKARDEAAAAHEAASAVLEERRRQHDATEASWRAGRAAALAAGLVDGEPCPVCGSTSHPAPARPGDGADDAALAAARERLDEARRVSDERRDLVGVAERELAAAGAELVVLQGEVPAGLTPEAAGAAVEAASAKVAELAAAIAAVAGPDEVLAAASGRVEAAEKRLAAARQADKDAHGLAAERRALAGQLAAAVPEELRDPAALREALAAAAAEAERLEAEFAEAQKADAAAREGRVAAERDLEAARETHGRELKAAADARDAFVAALADQGFEQEDAYAAAVRNEAELAEAEAEVARHGRELGEAAGQLAQARSAVEEHPVTGELDQVERGHDEAARLAGEAQARHGEAAARLANLRAVREALDDLGERSREVGELYKVVGRLSDVANGQAEGAKVSFQRWVLGRYLDIVLVAASERLRAMSRERYELHRQQEATDLRRASGLELAVADSWSNRSRPAVTLSGGESFLAALSLALGLAETVEEQSGGVRLETIFVDEGFGALDQSALDLAMEALVQLKDTGRLVGVISHVPELRQVIKARLEVRGGPGGSSTSFHLP